MGSFQSKRAKEMSALADSLSYKISKFLSFTGSTVESLFQLNRHINFQRSFRIMKGQSPTKSYDFWTWLSLQYEYFAKCMELVHLSNITIPDPKIHAAPVSEKNYLVSDIPASLVFDSVPDPVYRVSTSTCLVQLMHAGFYYLMGAKCALLGESYFQEALKRLGGLDNVPESDLSAEKAVDRVSIALDLFTKAYDHFKKNKQSRMTFLIAAELAKSNHIAGTHDLAIK